MATSQQLLDLAHAQEGTTESPPNSNCQKYSKELGRPCEAWCADSVVWLMRQVGITLPSESAYTPSMYGGFVKANTAVLDIQHGLKPGDVILFDFVAPFNTHGIQHVGIFKSYAEPGYVNTYEGNTSSGEGGSQDNGGGYYTRKRPIKFIVGAGRPAYEEHAAVKPPMFVPTPVEGVPMALIRPRSQGGYVILQTGDGGVFSYNDAPFLGSVPGAGGHGPVIDLAWTPSGNGYWILASDGGVFSFGDAAYHGGWNNFDPNIKGNRVAIGIVAAGNGYLIVGQDPSGDGSPYDSYGFGV